MIPLFFDSKPPILRLLDRLSAKNTLNKADDLWLFLVKTLLWRLYNVFWGFCGVSGENL